MAAPARIHGRERAARRSAARLAAAQALYQMDIAGTDVGALLAEYEAHRLGREIEGEQYNAADAAFFRDLVEGVVREQVPLDRRIDALLLDGWPLVRLDATLRAILRAGAFELMFRPDVPPRATINEYVDVAHAFFEGDETRIVNGLLDRLAREARPDEFA